MAINAVSEGNSLEQYVTAVRSVWGDGKDPDLPYRIKGLLEKLFSTTRPKDPWSGW